MEKTIILHGLTLDELTVIIEAAVETKVTALLSQVVESPEDKIPHP